MGEIRALTTYFMQNATTLLRKTFPKVRIVTIKGETLYVVDARKKGTAGKREYFYTQKEALERAGAIEDELGLHGTEALISSKLRNMALEGEALLKPYGKTVMDGILFFKAHLDAEAAKSDSRTITSLATDWANNKENGSNRVLKAITVKGIKKHAKLLQELWGSKRILDFTEADFQTYLDGLKLGQRRKFNLRSLTSQFFNWCIAKKYCKTNPVEKIEISVPRSKIHILKPEEAKQHLKVCETMHPDYTLYVAISLFAGLRPMECKLLQWENINLEEKQITVLDSTSKVAETRNVPIEDNLLLWLNAHKGERKGFVTRQANFINNMRAVRGDMGYKAVIFAAKRIEGKVQSIGTTVNPNGPEWPEDVYRHSYASYWLAKNKDRAHLAEHMGNSIQIIKRHYKAVIANSAQEAFWNLKPGLQEPMPANEKAAKATRAKKLGAIVPPNATTAE